MYFCSREKGKKPQTNYNHALNTLCKKKKKRKKLAKTENLGKHPNLLLDPFLNVFEGLKVCFARYGAFELFSAGYYLFVKNFLSFANRQTAGPKLYGNPGELTFTTRES